MQKVLSTLSRRALSTSSVARSGSFTIQLTSKQQEIRDLSRKFTRDEIIPKAKYHDETGEFPWDILKKAHSVGLMHTHIPQEFGGMGMNLFNNCMITEEIAYGCTGVSVTLSATSLGSNAVKVGGSFEQKKKYLSRLIEEPLLTSFAVTEPGAGSDVNSIKTKAVKKGDEYILNGNKMWISNAGVANYYIVFARTNPDPKASASSAFSCFIVESSTPGVTFGRKEINLGQKCADNRAINFEDVRVPKENILIGEGAGFKLTMNVFDSIRSSAGAGATGLAARAMHEATQYALQRNTFGVPIETHQAVSDLLADMAIGVESARLSWMRAACEVDQMSPDRSYHASIAKVYAADIANRVASDAVQVLGADGLNSEYPVEKLMRDVKVYQIYEGPSPILRNVIAKALLKKAAQNM